MVLLQALQRDYKERAADDRLWAFSPWLAGVPASLTGRASCLRRRVVGVAVRTYCCSVRRLSSWTLRLPNNAIASRPTRR
jgi:hypothetical protein